MKLNLYCYFDKELGAFTYPQPTAHDKEQFTQAIARAVKAGKVPNKDSLKLFYVGVFDDDKGVFLTFEPQLLLDLSTIPAPAVKLEEVPIDESL